MLVRSGDRFQWIIPRSKRDWCNARGRDADVDQLRRGHEKALQTSHLSLSRFQRGSRTRCSSCTRAGSSPAECSEGITYAFRCHAAQISLALACQRYFRSSVRHRAHFWRLGKFPRHYLPRQRSLFAAGIVHRSSAQAVGLIAGAFIIALATILIYFIFTPGKKLQTDRAREIEAHTPAHSFGTACVAIAAAERARVEFMTLD